MRLTASDFVSCHRPTQCDLRVFLRHHGEAEAAAGPYDEVLHRLGLKHEREHLATLGAFADVSDASFQAHVKRTAAAIAQKVPVLYQAAFSVNAMLGGVGVEIVGVPDFLILDGDGYLIRDSKMARRIDEENHPEILLQVQLYGWLFEKSCGTPPPTPLAATVRFPIIRMQARKFWAYLRSEQLPRPFPRLEVLVKRPNQVPVLLADRKDLMGEASVLLKRHGGLVALDRLCDTRHVWYGVEAVRLQADSALFAL